MKRRSYAMAGIAAFVVAGCGSDQETVRTVTQQETVVEKAPPAKTVTVKQKVRRPKPVAASTITVPDVVGENHQYAQDEMQAAGLYNLDERDATGQGRVLLWDRNWIVVSQDPPAGTEVDADATITLSSKKDDE